MAMLTIKAVIFDIGGVLAHDVWEHLFLDENTGLWSQFSLDKHEVERVGELLWQSFAYLPETQQRNWQELEQLYWGRFIEYFRDQLPSSLNPHDFINMTDHFIHHVEGMIPVLEILQSKGFELAICSNNNEFWFRRQMEKLQLHRFFSPSKVILSCRIGVSKSSSRYEMFHRVADSLGFAKANCIFIDDREVNVTRARECGMIAILFSDAQQLTEKLGELCI